MARLIAQRNINTDAAMPAKNTKNNSISTSHAFYCDHFAQFAFKVLVFRNNVQSMIAAICLAVIVPECHNASTNG
jgi:hypothetical protein